MAPTSGDNQDVSRHSLAPNHRSKERWTSTEYFTVSRAADTMEHQMF